MRVAIVTHLLKQEDGQGRVNLELAQELLSRGHSLVLLASAVDPRLTERSAVRWIRIPPSRLPTYLLREQVFALRSSVALARVRRSVDAVVVNGFTTWLPSDVNLVHFVHAAWLRSPHHPARTGRGVAAAYRWLYTAANARFEKVGFRRSGAVVAVSDVVRRQLIECGVPASRISVVPNGVDLDLFAPGPGSRGAFGLPEEGFVAMFAGDLRTSRKNLDTVLRALVATPGVRLAVAGDTRGSPYPEMARALKIADRVHFLGLIADIAALMRAADAFIFPSRFEPFGLVLLEASACGLPVIAARTAGACDMLVGDGMVALDDPDDVAGLADALRTLSSDTELRGRMGRSARAAAERLSWKAATLQHARIIEHVAVQRVA